TLTVNRASNLFRLGEIKRAQAVGLDGLRRMEALRSKQPAAPSVAVAYSITLNRLEQSQEAARLLSVARDQARALGNEYWSALANYHLGRSMMLTGRFDQAQQYIEEAQQAWGANETANRERLADLSRTLAELELARGRTS